MNTFIILALAHLIADFPLQTNRVFKLKNEGHLGLLIHVIIHLLVASLLISQPWRYWSALAFLGVAHYLTDWAKLRLPDSNQPASFLVDQLIHFITIGIIALWLPTLPAVLPMWLMVIGLVLAFIPGIMTFLWVLAINLDCESELAKCGPVVWTCRQLLPISQRMGGAVVLLLMFVGITI